MALRPRRSAGLGAGLLQPLGFRELGIGDSVCHSGAQLAGPRPCQPAVPSHPASLVQTGHTVGLCVDDREVPVSQAAAMCVAVGEAATLLGGAGWPEGDQARAVHGVRVLCLLGSWVLSSWGCFRGKSCAHLCPCLLEQMLSASWVHV